MRTLPVLDELVATDVTRRGFIGAAASVVAVTLLSGCSSAMVTYSLTPVDGKISVDISEYPDLAKPNGSIKVQPKGARHYIYVLTEGDKKYVALSPVCTHAGCLVDVVGDQLICPCHKSIFDRKGEVLDGPAPVPLPQYRTTLKGNILTIDLNPIV